MAISKQMNGISKRRALSINLANALFFFGLALFMNVYVVLTIGLGGTPHETNVPVNAPRNEPAMDRNAIETGLLRSKGTMGPATIQCNYNKTRTSPSLAIVSACIPGQRFPPEYIRISHQNKLNYCQRYNARCILPSHRVEEKSGLHAKWDKLYHIKHTLDTEHVDWVLWMDCDAVFTHFEIDWYQHLKPYLNSTRLMLVSKDSGGYNLGVFLVPNTDASKKFIDDMYKQRWSLDKKFFHKDQTALKVMIEKHPSIEERIKVVPQKVMNTYLDNDAGEKWTPYSWIMHQVFCQDAAGCTANFTKVMAMVTPHYFLDAQEEKTGVK